MKPTPQERELMARFANRKGAPDRGFLDGRRDKLIRALTKDGSKPARTLIQRLQACTDRKPCKSAACPHCRNREQLKQMMRLHAIWPAGTELITTSVIIKSLEKAPGRLHTLKLASIKRSLRRKLEDAGAHLIPIWGYVDLSFNTHADETYPPHWLPHPHIITEARFIDNLDPLREHLKRSASVKRPMKIKQIKNWDVEVSYACKPEPKHRADFTRMSSAAHPSEYPLKPDQAVEAALWLADHHPRERQFWCDISSHREQFVTENENVSS